MRFSQLAGIRIDVRILLVSLFVLVVVGAVPVEAQSPNQAGLVVLHGDGSIVTSCVEYTENSISGYEFLQRSGLKLDVEAGGLGATICGLDNEGCSVQQGCFCQCVGTPCIYWSYWRLIDNAWVYSSLGASSTQVTPGSVEGWVWGEGTIGTNADIQPPSTSFEEICVSPTSTVTATVTGEPPTATDTPTATPTHTREPSTRTPTPIPNATLTPTPGPAATPTFTPIPLPSIRLFQPDRSAIAFGESVTLTWDVADATSVLLRYPGGEEIVATQGSKVILPEQTVVYSLFASNQIGENSAEATIMVNPIFSAPTALPADTSIPLPTPIPSDTPAPTETWTPSPVPADTPASTPTLSPTETAVPMEVSTSTEPPTPTEIPESPISPIAGPVITVVVVAAVDAETSVSVDAAVVAPAVQSLPSTTNSRAEQESDQVQRAVLLGGLAFVFGAPLVFGAIWFIVWSLWRKE